MSAENLIIGILVTVSALFVVRYVVNFFRKGGKGCRVCCVKTPECEEHCGKGDAPKK